MKKIFVLLMAVVLSFTGTSNVFAADTVADFEDVRSDAYYFDAITYVNEKGLMTGRDNTHFGPDGYLERQELAVIIGRHYTKVLNSKLDLNTPDEAYYTGFVKWVKKHQIMNGYADGNFGVGDNITRQDFIVVLDNYIQQIIGYDYIPEREPEVLGQFVDSRNIGEYAREAMYWNVVNGTIRGYEADGTMVLDPDGFVTRGMAAVMLERFFEYYGDDIMKDAIPFEE